MISNYYSDDLNLLKNADIITTATTSTKALFENSDLKQSVHINAVGSYKPSLIEINPETISSSKLILDQKSAAMIEAGDIQNALNNNFEIKDENIFELGEIKDNARHFMTQRTVFKSVGNALQDLVLASTIYQKIYSGSDS